MRYGRKGFDFGDFEITKREILASISIIAIMILLGILISARILEIQLDKNEKYNKAVKIKSHEMFQYGIDTSVGNAFVYGDLKAVDPVTYQEIGGGYMYVEKVTEKYTQHTRTVRHSDGKKSWYTTETYWTWDTVGIEDIKCSEVSFCGIVFPSCKIELPEADYIDTIEESSHVRYKYYGTGAEYSGTIFTELKDNTISDNTKFYNNLSIDETVECLESDAGIIIFWIFWVIFTGGIVFGFFYLDNTWLD